MVAIDGTKFFGSNKKICDECLQSNNHNFHSVAVMATVGDGPKQVLDFEIIAKRYEKNSTIITTTKCSVNGAKGFLML